MTFRGNYFTVVLFDTNVAFIGFVCFALHSSDKQSCIATLHFFFPPEL